MSVLDTLKDWLKKVTDFVVGSDPIPPPVVKQPPKKTAKKKKRSNKPKW